MVLALRCRRWPLLVALSAVALVAGCGEEVEPVPRSTLPGETPSIAALTLVDALPKPADFGPGWTLDAGSVAHEDMIAELARGKLSELCEWANPDRAGIDRRSAAHVISANFKSSDNESVAVSLMVDSPARSAERFTYLRRVADECDETIIGKDDGEDIVRKVTVLDDPRVEADESIAFTLADKGGEYRSSGRQTCARIGGLLVCMSGTNTTDAILAASVTRARNTLNL